MILQTKSPLLSFASRFLWILLASCLFFLIWLGQYSRPQSDDLGWFFSVQKLGTFGTLHKLWQVNGGRFFSNTLIVVAARSGWPLTVPWLIPMISIFCQWLASFFLLHAINKHLPRNAFSHDILFYSLFLTIAPFIVVPQPSTAIYWYTGVALYQWSYILTLLLITTFLKWLTQKKTIWLWITALLLLFTGNTNELSSIFINTSFVVFCYFLFKKGTIKKEVVLFVSVVAILALVLNLSAPGLYVRKTMIPKTSHVLSTPAAWLFWMSVSAGHLLSLPITWILAADYSSVKSFRLTAKQHRTLLTLLSVTLLMILYGTGGSLAFRTLNILVIFLGLLILAGVPKNSILPVSFSTTTRKWLYTAAIFATPFTYQMIEAAIAGPGFAKAYDAQWNSLQDSIQILPQVPTLAHTMDSLARSGSKRKLVEKTASKIPSLLWFDNAENERTTVQYMLRLTKKDTIAWNSQFIFNAQDSLFDQPMQNIKE